LTGAARIIDRLVDDAGWLRQCAGGLTHLHANEYPPAVNLRPDGDYPGPHAGGGRPARVAAILPRIAADVDELARARRVADLGAAGALPDRRAERRCRACTSGSSAATASCPSPSAPGTCSPHEG
jgi:hypothetical protein